MNFNYVKTTCLTLLILVPYLLTGQDFNMAHKKAKQFSHKNIDSAMFYASNMLNLAENKDQKRKAFDFIGYLANHNGLYKLSEDCYREAANNSQDNLQKHRYYLNIGIVLQQSNIEMSSLIADSCIKVFNDLGNKEYKSFAYDLKANTSLESNECLIWFRKSLGEKSRESKGYVYPKIAKAFARFEQIDSAIYYQRLAIDKFPIKTPKYQVENYALMAKYLLSGDKTKDAKKMLDIAYKIKCNDFITKGLLQCCWALYYLDKGNMKNALKSLSKMDKEIELSEGNANNIADKRNRHLKSIDMYKAILGSNIDERIKNKYNAKKEKSEAFIKGMNTGIEKGSIENTLMRGLFRNKETNSTKTVTWLVGVFGGLFLIFYAIRGPYSVLKKVPQPADKAPQEIVLITRIEERTGVKINQENRSMILMLWEGLSFEKVANAMGIKEDTARKRMWRLAKKGGKTDIRDLF